MNSFENKVAFVTGAASGIGLALTKALVKDGAKVMMADINADMLEDAAAALRAQDGNVANVVCDVRDAASVRAAADATIAAFGKVHIVANNAGVSLAGVTGEVALEDWRWIVDINLMGVVYGVEIFTPLIKSHGEGGHFINTASMAGHFTMSRLGPYNATKFAVVGYSEALVQELAQQGINVTVLCPTWVQSNIVVGGEGRPSNEDNAAPNTSKMYQSIKALVENGMSAEAFVALALDAVRKKQFYVFNDPEARVTVDMRRDAILKDYDACLKFIEETAADS